MEALAVEAAALGVLAEDVEDAVDRHLVEVGPPLDLPQLGDVALAELERKELAVEERRRRAPVLDADVGRAAALLLHQPELRRQAVRLGERAAQVGGRRGAAGGKERLWR